MVAQDSSFIHGLDCMKTSPIHFVHFYVRGQRESMQGGIHFLMLHMKLSQWTSKAGMSAFLMFSLSSGRFMLSWRLKRVEIVLKKTTECSRH